MADLDAQALAKMPREQLVSLVVNNLNLISAEEADKMRNDEIVHLLRMNLDVDYQKQVSAVSQANSKKTAPKKNQQPKKAKAVKETEPKRNVEKKSGEKMNKKDTANAEISASQDAEKAESKKPSKTIKSSVAAKSSTKKNEVKSQDSTDSVKTDVVEQNDSNEQKVISDSAKETDGLVKPKAKRSPSSRKKTAEKQEQSDVAADATEDIKEVAKNEPSGDKAAEGDVVEVKKKKSTSAKSKKTVKTTSDADLTADTAESKPDVVAQGENDSSEAGITQTDVTDVKSETKSGSRRKKTDSASKNVKKQEDNKEEKIQAQEDKNINPEKAESTENGEKSVPADKENRQNRNQFKKAKRRTIVFGPGVETKVEATAEADNSASDNNKDAASSDTQESQPAEPEIQLIPVAGVLSIGAEKNDYCGFLHANNYLPGEADAYVSGQLIRRMGLRKGDFITGLATPARGKGNAPLKQILTVNDIDVSAEDFDIDIIRRRKKFENLTAIYPDEKLVLETAKDDYSTRIIDIICPIGKGQRGMVVSPPKAGKTVLLKKIANAITTNNPKCKLIVLLIDERPEEVTDMQRSIKGEVVYSTFDKKPENHVRVTELVLERAMRLVELDEDVVILLDSMTRLARAYNLTITPTGRTLSGGLGPGSLYGPKRFFGAARNIENGGSLTIISTSLIETGSRMDEVIFEEFKGTGNMEVVLDRKLADRRVFPAIAVDKSGTRREDLLLSPEELDAVWKLRKRIADFDTVVATDLVIKLMERTPSNQVFVDTVIKKFDEMDQR